MQIHLKKIIPAYFNAPPVEGSDIWLKDLEFRQGERIQIIAPSGSGKTSLIHFLYGMRTDFRGDILLNDQSIKHTSAEKLSAIRRDALSIVFQDLRLFDEQTVLQNLEIKRQLNPYHPSHYIIDMTRRLGVEEKLSTPAKICSYGEQQRIAIIRALLQPFDFLLLDEPFSHLDDQNKTKALDLIIEECDKKKASIILADLHRVDEFAADQIYYL